MSQVNLLEKLMEWYEEQCDGEWEHGSGLVIDTLDNPGWTVRIDLRGTPFERTAFEPINSVKSRSDWIVCVKKGQEFEGQGDPSKLSMILEHFLTFVGKL